MFDRLLPAIEDNIRSDNGMVPVVFAGLDHIMEKKVPMPEMSKHTTHELFYLRNGKVEFMIDGKKVSVDKGNALIIRPNTPHSAKIITPVADTIVLYFGFSKDRDHTGRSQPSLESFLDFAEGDEEASKEPYLIISGSNKKSISKLMERIVEENSGDLYAKDLMMQILTVELMITLSRALKSEWEESLRVRNGKARELVIIAKEYIDSNYDRGITVANAASYVYLSQGYFTRAFRDEFGISPMSYLMKKRIERACELLENKEIKVSGVAAQAGFSSPQRFNVAFRKQMGITPMEYRKEHSSDYEE
ncbi:transcriptional regulator, AraC family [Ruminococcaceae bacterium KH2T8]|nr:transcriptional regulator, AraC family [Ruminococcaceae bacterium KH2T8]